MKKTTNRSIAIRGLCAMTLMLLLRQTSQAQQQLPVGTARPRVIVTTDGEQDDLASMHRFIFYTNDLDVAGIAYQGGAQKGSSGKPTPLLADFLIHRAGR